MLEEEVMDTGSDDEVALGGDAMTKSAERGPPWRGEFRPVHSAESFKLLRVAFPWRVVGVDLSPSLYLSVPEEFANLADILQLEFLFYSRS